MQVLLFIRPKSWQTPANIAVKIAVNVAVKIALKIVAKTLTEDDL